MKLKNKYGFKQMNLLGTYLVPVTPSTSKMLQEIVFELGGGWKDRAKEFVHHEHEPFLVLECKKEDIELFYLSKLGKNHKDYIIIQNKDMIIKLLRQLVYKQSFKIKEKEND